MGNLSLEEAIALGKKSYEEHDIKAERQALSALLGPAQYSNVTNYITKGHTLYSDKGYAVFVYGRTNDSKVDLSDMLILYLNEKPVFAIQGPLKIEKDGFFLFGKKIWGKYVIDMSRIEEVALRGPEVFEYLGQVLQLNK